MNMNREIKFRAWDKEANSWYDDSNQHLVINLDGTLTNCWNGELMEDYTERIILIPFTGLKDKNGVEIYEGDIVECFNDGLSEVLFRKGSFGTLTYTSRGVDFYTFNEVYGACEIIGNIYENPEWLEVEV